MRERWNRRRTKADQLCCGVVELGEMWSLRRHWWWGFNGLQIVTKGRVASKMPSTAEASSTKVLKPLKNRGWWQPHGLFRDLRLHVKTGDFFADVNPRLAYFGMNADRYLPLLNYFFIRIFRKVFAHSSHAIRLLREWSYSLQEWFKIGYFNLKSYSDF